MTSRWTAGLRAVGVAGAVVSAAAAGAAAGVVAERYVVRRRREHEDPYADEPFGALPFDSERTVLTSDGIPLHVEILEAGEAGTKPEITVVFVHGFCLDMGTWHFQRKALTELRGTPPNCRIVLYDQPGHGKSGGREGSDYHLDQLGRDLARVIEKVCPTGPLVLAGHSMGAMTIMALAEQQPALFDERVVGVALISTSAGHLDEVGLGIPPALARFRKPLMPTISGALRWQPELAEVGRRAGSDLAYLLTLRYGFGTRHASPALVEYVERMNSETSIAVIAAYLGTLSEHDRYAALEVFDGIEALIVCGDKDMLTPVQHTREIARLLPGAELVEVEEGGHVTLMEHADLVNAHFLAFLRRAARSAATGRPSAITKAGQDSDGGAAKAARRATAARSGRTERRILGKILRRRGV